MYIKGSDIRNVMQNKVLVTLVIACLIVGSLALIISLAVFLQMQPIIGASQLAVVTTKLDGNEKIEYINNGSTPYKQYIFLNGTVTNDSPSTAYNVGLNVTQCAVKTVPYGTVNNNSPVKMVNVIVPINSGTYSYDGSFNLPNLPAHESIQVNIVIVSPYDSSFCYGSPYFTAVWSNSP
jgi:hypothetical protein